MGGRDGGSFDFGAEAPSLRMTHLCGPRRAAEDGFVEGADEGQMRGSLRCGFAFGRDDGVWLGRCGAVRLFGTAGNFFGGGDITSLKSAFGCKFGERVSS